MNAESRLKPYDIEERDTNVQGYSDSNTREDVENKEQVLNQQDYINSNKRYRIGNQDIGGKSEKLAMCEEAMEYLKELLKPNVEAEIAQTDRTIEAAKQEAELI